MKFLANSLGVVLLIISILLGCSYKVKQQTIQPIDLEGFYCYCWTATSKKMYKWRHEKYPTLQLLSDGTFRKNTIMSCPSVGVWRFDNRDELILIDSINISPPRLRIKSYSYESRFVNSEDSVLIMRTYKPTEYGLQYYYLDSRTKQWNWVEYGSKQYFNDTSYYIIVPRFDSLYADFMGSYKGIFQTDTIASLGGESDSGIKEIVVEADNIKVEYRIYLPTDTMKVIDHRQSLYLRDRYDDDYNYLRKCERPIIEAD